MISSTDSCGKVERFRSLLYTGRNWSYQVWVGWYSMSGGTTTVCTQLLRSGSRK